MEERVKQNGYSNSKFNSIENLLLLYSVTSEKSISWIDIHTVNAMIFNSLGPDLIDMAVPVSDNGLEPNQQQAFTIVNVDLAPMS